jgi:hypothetical protein
VGAFVAAAMSGRFLEQLTDFGNAALLSGSVMHVVGLGAAMASAVAMVFQPRSAGLESE